MMTGQRLRLAQGITYINEKWEGIRHRRRLWFFVYTLTFLISFLIAYSSFLIEGKSFIWALDGRAQTYPWLVYIGERVRDVFAGFLKGNYSVPMYDLSMGWGDDIIGFMGSYAQLDPIAVSLSALVPMVFSETLYGFLIIMRMYLAGLAFMTMCRYFGKHRFESLVGAVIYVFSAYTAYASTAYPYFLIFMVILPLIIVGTDKIMKREKAGSFVFCVFYTAICSYYFLFMLTIMVGVYALVRFFDVYDRGNRKNHFFPILGRGITLYFLGLALAAPVLVPGVFELFQSVRNDYSHVSVSSSFLVHWRYFWERLLTLITPKREYELEWGQDFPCYAAIALPTIVLQFTSKRRNTLKWLLGIALLFLFSPYGGLIMNGLQYTSNRWAFGLALVVAYSVTDSIPVLFRLEKRDQNICLIVLLLYVLITIITTIRGVTIAFPLLGVSFLTITTVFIIAIQQYQIQYRFERLKKTLCIALVVLNVGVNSIYMFSSNLMGWADRFEAIGNETLYLAASTEAVASQLPYGNGIEDGRIDSSSFFYNYSMVYGVPGTSIYTSTLNGNVSRLWDAFEGSGNIQNFRIYSTDRQTMLDALLSVRYQLKWDGSEELVSYGYQNIGTLLNTQVYENQYALPWGYTYSDSVSVNSLEKLNGVEKQEILLQAVALDDGNHVVSDFTLDSTRIPYTAELSDCTWEGDVLDISTPNAAITLQTDMDAGKEYYLRVVGFNIDGFGDEYLAVSASASFDFYVECDGTITSGRAMAKEYPWYYGRENYLFCLGCSDNNRDSVSIHFPVVGSFKLGSIELIELPMDHYAERIESLCAEKLEDIEITSNKITGTIELSGDKILCLSVPYSKGWTATIDGNSVPIMKANYAFMGIEVPKGQHEIEFCYFTPGLAAGLCIGAIGVIVLVVSLFLTTILGKKNQSIEKDNGINPRETPSPKFDYQKAFGSALQRQCSTDIMAIPVKNNAIGNAFALCRKHYIDVILLQVIFFAFCLHKKFITYETNDDFYMSMILNGAWGQPTDHLVFINIILGRFLRLLVSMTPTIGWYYYFQGACCLSAFTCVGIVIKRKNDLIYWLSLPAILWMVERECYQSMQFTKTAGVLAAAGALLIIDSFERSDWHILESFAGGLLIFVSSLFRLDSTVITCGVFSVFVLGQAIKNRKINVKVCTVWVVTFVLCFAATAYNTHVYQSDPDWARFTEFNKKRTLINDWNISDWEDYFTAYNDEYKQAGIDPNDLLMMRYWSFTDPAVYDTDFVDTAVALKKQTMADYRHSSSYMRTYFSSMFSIIRNESLLILLFALLLICFFACRKCALDVLGIPLMLLVLALYCFHVDRYWNHRALFTILCGAILLLIYLIAHSDKWVGRPFIRSLMMLLTIAMMGVIWIQGALEPTPNNESLQYTLQEMCKQDDMLYMVEPLDNWLLNSVDAREPLQEGTCKNLCDTGGWLVNSPIIATIFMEHHVVNPWAECVDNDNISFVDRVRIGNKVDYIARHYSPDAVARLDRLSSGAHIYSICSNDLSKNSSVYIEDVENIEYQVECLPEGDCITIYGNICKRKQSTFDQSVFFMVTSERKPDVYYDAVMMEDETYPPENSRHFAGFIGQINVHDLQGDEKKVYLCLKDDVVHKIDITKDLISDIKEQPLEAGA